MHLQAVAVLCGTSNRAPQSHLDLAREVGAYLAMHNVKIVSGGCRMGLMEQLCTGAATQQGRLEGVVTQDLAQERYLSPHLQHCHVVPTFKERKKSLFALSQAVLYLPGGVGSLDEMLEALSENQQALSGVPSATFRPIALLAPDNFFEPIKEFLHQLARFKYIDPAHLELCGFFNTIEDAFEYLASYSISKQTYHWWD